MTSIGSRDFIADAVDSLETMGVSYVLAVRIGKEDSEDGGVMYHVQGSLDGSIEDESGAMKQALIPYLKEMQKSSDER